MTGDDSTHSIRCTEVWGGNHAVDRDVAMSGLDAWVLATPLGGDSAGGDIHYVSACATGRIIRALVADVSGHGIAVADLAHSLRELMRRYINYVDESRIVEGLNREFARAAGAGQFATAVVATCWTPTHELTITCAGHPRPLIYRGSSGRWSLVGAASGSDAGPTDLPLGVADDTTFSTARLTLEPHDLVLLYTDPYIESPRPDGTMRGMDGLVRACEALDPADPRTLLASLQQDSRRAGGPRADDMTLLALRPNEHAPRGSIATGLAATARLSRAAVASLAGRAMPWPERRLRNIGGAFFDRFNHTQPGGADPRGPRYPSP